MRKLASYVFMALCFGGLGGVYFGLTKRRPHTNVVSEGVPETTGLPPRYTRDAPAEDANMKNANLRAMQRIYVSDTEPLCEGVQIPHIHMSILRSVLGLRGLNKLRPKDLERHGTPLRLESRGLARYKVLNGNLYTTRDWNTTRSTKRLANLLVLNSLLKVLQRFQHIEGGQRTTLPDVDLVVGLMSGPPSFPNVFSGCARPAKQTVSMPSYHEADCWVEEGKQGAAANNHSYLFTLQSYLEVEDRRRVLANAAFPNPDSKGDYLGTAFEHDWQRRISKAAWRGRCTGRGYEPGLVHKQPRVAIMKLSRQHPQLLDARLFFSKGCAKVEHLVEFGDTAKDYLREEDMQRFKYLVDIEGDGCSGRLSKLLGSGSVVLKYFRRGQQHYVQQMRPFVHYVPIRPDLSDLLQKIRWLQTNDDRARLIAHNAKHFAMVNLSPLAVDCYWLKLLLAYASVQGFAPKKEKDDVLITQSQKGVLHIPPIEDKVTTSSQAKSNINSLKSTRSMWHRVTCPAKLSFKHMSQAM